MAENKGIVASVAAGVQGAMTSVQSAVTGKTPEQLAIEKGEADKLAKIEADKKAEAKKKLTLKEQKAKQEAEFQAILAKQREEAVKKAHVMTREERAKQTKEFTAMIAAQSVGKAAPKVMTWQEKEANKIAMLKILDKQREDMAKRGKI
jgi:Rieske Fe-S protein